MTSRTRVGMLAFAVAGLLASSLAWLGAQQGGTRVAIDPDDIGGVVSSSKGPEAGVWVIAESTNLPTKMARIVVTDRKSTRLNSSHSRASRMPSSA